ncbi:MULTISPECIES: tRNA dihydrouridine(20/20a) synthase DusA [Pseudanabaena]|uniref:tRNA-dihydrouridine(20/20a) synthase n=2 Tax=Pseudanabaena TaxID=1152 RepID=L8MTZ5_9CYAN|nr:MULTISPECIES: tRNA dihydrouridine(20/20a) synthase DusA [Pseudanabaena]ELS30911.1 tRNA-U16,U17-dihydrouridine synthase [Pseudanabaena biceps PCC 7429]MDG3496831.1 tRNA dihydrouridine(20/20a) synthase DusA [Pseudanabaena catenata USMAC16]
MTPLSEMPIPTQEKSDRFPIHPLSIAPMMDRTDRHYRYFMRQITRRTLLYTEMVTSAAIKHGDRAYLLGFSPQENPLALQVGGDNPQDLAECARIAEGMGYDEINLNVGCPSDRVQSGHFGACLMKTPLRVAQCIEAMSAATKIPVSVKHRIGVDDLDRYEDMQNFVRILSESGCRRFSIHARKAWLQGLSPKDNREVPPLRYADVHRLKQEFPHLFIEINGGLITLEQAHEQLKYVDAVMIGRAAYDNPYLFATSDREFFGDETPIRSRLEVAEAMIAYIDEWMAKGLRLHKITRHMLQLFHGQAGSRLWKRILTDRSCLVGAGSEVIREAITTIH